MRALRWGALVVLVSIAGACGDDANPQPVATSSETTAAAMTSGPEAATIVATTASVETGQAATTSSPMTAAAGTTTTAAPIFMDVPPADLVEPEVVDAGAEPRRPLRLQLQPGTTFELTVTTHQAGLLDVSGTPQDLDTSTVATTRETVRSVQDGFAMLDVTYVSLDLGPQVDQSVVAQILGIKVTMRLDDHGRPRAITADTGSVSPQFQPLVTTLLEGLEQPVLALPVEPVGVGAKWRTSSNVKFADLTFKLDTEITVVGLDDQHISYNVGGAYTAGRATSDLGVTVTSSTKQGHGTTRFDEPAAAEVTDGSISLSIATGGTSSDATTSTSNLEQHSESTVVAVS